MRHISDTELSTELYLAAVSSSTEPGTEQEATWRILVGCWIGFCHAGANCWVDCFIPYVGQFSLFWIVVLRFCFGDFAAVFGSGDDERVQLRFMIFLAMAFCWLYSCGSKSSGRFVPSGMAPVLTVIHHMAGLG
ncbi:hypothetical protein KFK09_016847 [Dendrobium nobile]|uniref:Uncharacterized protein n=1 Tax=Dendrobium nobile TaxID=94219 RepID=A0A8T3B1S4_DENNO|nr:hypothetical protein KFK09_016847 [Dendrobium nobile]